MLLKFKVHKNDKKTSFQMVVGIKWDSYNDQGSY
jgi:hypothetical protein